MRSKRPARRTPAVARATTPARARSGTAAAEGATARPAQAESPFVQAVARVVRRIPRGTTLGYAEVALRAGKPGAARLAVRALNRLDDVPWWRVARSDGTLAPAVAFDQEQLLRAEGWRGPPGKPKRRERAPPAHSASPTAGRRLHAPKRSRGEPAGRSKKIAARATPRQPRLSGPRAG